MQFIFKKIIRILSKKQAKKEQECQNNSLLQRELELSKANKELITEIKQLKKRLYLYEKRTYSINKTTLEHNTIQGFNDFYTKDENVERYDTEYTNLYSKKLTEIIQNNCIPIDNQE